MPYPTVLKKVPVVGHGAQAPGAYVLRDFGPDKDHRYVVHFYNSQCGGYSDGSYLSDLSDAERKLRDRSARVAAYHARLAERGISTATSD